VFEFLVLLASENDSKSSFAFSKLRFLVILIPPNLPALPLRVCRKEGSLACGENSVAVLHPRSKNPSKILALRKSLHKKTT
jgi:hypothetical protein